MYVCICIYICVYVLVCMHVCMCVYIYYITYFTAYTVCVVRHTKVISFVITCNIHAPV